MLAVLRRRLHGVMSRHITNAGAFCAYVAHGLGRELGLGASLLCARATRRRGSPSGSPRCSACSRPGRSRTCSGSTSRGRSGSSWWWPARFLGHRWLAVSARVVGVALCLEPVVVFVVAGAVVVGGGASGLSAEPFAPSHIFGAEARRESLCRHPPAAWALRSSSIEVSRMPGFRPSAFIGTEAIDAGCCEPSSLRDHADGEAEHTLAGKVSAGRRCHAPTTLALDVRRVALSRLCSLRN